MSEKKVILASHGELSRGMMHSVQMIVGQNEDLSCMGMMPGEHYQPMVDKVREMAEQNPQTQFIVITDLFGGSVCNGMTMLAGYPNVKVLTGMNMGLVINVLLTPGALTEEQLAEIIGSHGRRFWKCSRYSRMKGKTSSSEMLQSREKRKRGRENDFNVAC